MFIVVMTITIGYIYRFYSVIPKVIEVRFLTRIGEKVEAKTCIKNRYGFYGAHEI